MSSEALEIAHRDKIYPGNHPAIVDDETFDRVQAMLADHRQGQPRTRKARPSLLAGKVVDAKGGEGKVEGKNEGKTAEAKAAESKPAQSKSSDDKPALARPA